MVVIKSRAAATARRALLEKAATELALDATALTVRDGIVVVKNARDSTRKLPIGTLVSGMSLNLRLDNDAPLKAPIDYTTVADVLYRAVYEIEHDEAPEPGQGDAVLGRHQLDGRS